MPCPAESLYLAVADVWRRIESRHAASGDAKAAAEAHRAVTDSLLQAARARAEHRRGLHGQEAA